MNILVAKFKSKDSLLSSQATIPIYYLLFREAEELGKTDNVGRSALVRFREELVANREIAEQCSISQTTVKAHLRRILVKLEVKNRAQAVARAIEKGYLNQSLN